MATAGACLWAIWNEWVNEWHDEHLQSTATALVLLAGAAAAALRSDRLYEVMRRQPLWGFVPAAAATAAIWIDGTQGSELYVISVLTLVPVAVVAPRSVTLSVAGFMADEIADRLYLSTRTVQSHVANAMRKTDTTSRTQLAILMIRDGLVPIAPPSAPDDDPAGVAPSKA